MTELELLDHIDPALLDYHDWLNVGFVLGKKLAKEKYEFDRGIEP
ncbi:MAG: PriCT-2 domain-containing protein [Bacteroidales bacterium]|jgi:hypothetical protein|nr:PriCT-2 domain-containing protein [Bacteroidales bacterium]